MGSKPIIESIHFASWLCKEIVRNENLLEGHGMNGDGVEEYAKLRDDIILLLNEHNINPDFVEELLVHIAHLYKICMAVGNMKSEED